MKKLLVITETCFDINDKCFVNKSTDLILNKYRLFFDEVESLSPSASNDRSNNFKAYHFIGYTPNNRLKGFYYLLTLFFNLQKLRKLLKEYNHVQFRMPSLYVFYIYLLASNSCRSKSIYLSGDWSEASRANGRSVFIAYIFEKLVRLIVSNEKLVTAGSVLASKYKDVSLVAPHFVSTTHDVSVLRSQTIDRPIRICMIGNLSLLKGLDRIEFFLNALRSRNLAFEFTLVGKGPETELVERLKKNHEGFIHIEALSVHEIYELLKSRHFLFHPSRSEGTPKVLSEALSVGCIPIADISIGSIGDIVEDMKTGLNYLPDDINQVVDNMERLLESKNFNKMAKNMYAKSSGLELTNQLQRIWKFVLYD